MQAQDYVLTHPESELVHLNPTSTPSVPTPAPPLSVPHDVSDRDVVGGEKPQQAPHAPPPQPEISLDVASRLRELLRSDLQ